MIYKYLTSNFDHFKKLNIAGPQPTILLGNLPGAITRKRSILYEIDDIYRLVDFFWNIINNLRKICI